MTDLESRRQPVLVVDDDPEAAESIKEALVRLGHCVMLATHGAEALDLAAEAIPAVVILKAALGGMHGFDVCREFREDGQLRDVPVLFLTRAGDGIDKMRGLEVGGTDFLAEPIDPAELKARIGTILRLRQVEALAGGHGVIDSLTGLTGRGYFEAELQRECNRARRYDTLFAVVTVDIDHFEQINERYGHEFGDRMLAGVAEVLRAHTRESDCVARWSGDEFAVLLPEGNLPKAIGFAKKLYGTLSERDFAFDGGATRITVSMGVASRQNIGGRDPSEIFRLARQCLQKAKDAGGDRIIYHTCGEYNLVRT